MTVSRGSFWRIWVLVFITILRWTCMFFRHWPVEPGASRNQIPAAQSFGSLSGCRGYSTLSDPCWRYHVSGLSIVMHSPKFSDHLLQISDVVAQLFSHLPQDRISNFTCGHIIPSTNLQTLVVCRGPRGADLEFKFDRRGDKSMVSSASGVLSGWNWQAPTKIAELGQILTNFINVVPGGMVTFFPSYSFLNTVKAEWTTSGTMEKFNAKKKVS